MKCNHIFLFIAGGDGGVENESGNSGNDNNYAELDIDIDVGEGKICQY